MSDLSRLNPTPHAIAVYASSSLSPVITQDSLPSGRCPLLVPDFHRPDRTSLPGALIQSPRRLGRGDCRKWHTNSRRLIGPSSPGCRTQLSILSGYGGRRVRNVTASRPSGFRRSPPTSPVDRAIDARIFSQACAGDADTNLHPTRSRRNEIHFDNRGDERLQWSAQHQQQPA
jgi:hypothetical protein